MRFYIVFLVDPHMTLMLLVWGPAFEKLGQAHKAVIDGVTVFVVIAILQERTLPLPMSFGKGERKR